MKINNVVPVETFGGCHMYYGTVDNGNWFFVTDAWDYGYITSSSPQNIMWDDDFEEEVNEIKVSELLDDDFYEFWEDMMDWLVNNGYKEFENY